MDLDNLLNENTDNKDITDKTETVEKVNETASNLNENLQQEPPLFSENPDNLQAAKMPIENVLPVEMATEIWCKGLKIFTEIGCKLALKKEVDIKFYAAEKNMIADSMEKVLKHYQINFSNPLHELLAASLTTVAFKVIDVSAGNSTATEKTKKERKTRTKKTETFKEPEGEFTESKKGAVSDIEKELTFD